MPRAGGGSTRNRYIDTLRAAAIARVIVYHAVGWAWLTVVLPAMGVMFALGGSLMAASLTARGARPAIRSRVRRLVPAMWALGLVAVPLMIWHGWSRTDSDHPLYWPHLVFWVIPIGDPPGSSWGEPLWEVLWYLRAYLWFVLASPLLYALYRRAPWVTVAAPFAALALLMVTGFRLPDAADGIMWDFVTYGGCWIAGFAHQDGRLRRLPPAVHLSMVAVLGTAGGLWLFTHPTEDGFDLNEVPVARALWSLAFVLAALRWQPTMAWLDRVRPLSAAVRLINARAVTVYLWHYPLITVAVFLLTPLSLAYGTPGYVVLLIALELVLVSLAVAALGWVEDLAARRRPSIWPLSKPRPAPEPVPELVS
jgi:peptidoglycan/LPS O-acetylase OafA/YrhL